MDELEKFKVSIANTTAQTQKVYVAAYNKLRKLLQQDIADTSEDTTIKVVKEETKNINTVQSLLNIAVLIRKMENLPARKIQNERKSNISVVETHTKETNKFKFEELPTLNDLEDYQDYLFENGKWTDYILNYLLLNYYVRNKDLNFVITFRKKDMEDKSKNYLWFDVRHKKALYVRRDYKTAGTYGEKQHTIKDKNFLLALKRVADAQKHNEESGEFIPNENQVGYYIMRSTYKGIGEANYLKIILRANLNGGNANLLKEIADSRGTDVNTLLHSYSIN